MPIDLVEFYTHFFYSFHFYEYLLQKTIDEYKEQNKDAKVRNNPILFKYGVLMSLNEANHRYSKHGLKEIFEPDKKHANVK